MELLNALPHRRGMFLLLIVLIVVALIVLAAGVKIRKQTKVGATVLILCGISGMVLCIAGIFFTMFLGFNS